MAKLTPVRLLAELRKLLARPDTKVRFRKLLTCGHSTWELDEDERPFNITIYADQRRDGRVRLVLHELLHIYMRLDRQMFYTLEEAAILAWEKAVYERLQSPKHHKELESWNQAIERKLLK